jgi:uncharacterized membrane protein YGL010W
MNYGMSVDGIIVSYAVLYNKTLIDDRRNITEITLKVALNTITPISVFYIRINNLQSLISSKVETTRTTIGHLNRCL